MDIHKNARLTVYGRERIVGQVMSGQTPQAVALAAGVCPRTIRKWLSRYRAEGLAGLKDRSSRPHRLRRPTSQQVVQKIEQLRRQRWTGKQIATEVSVSPATVSRVLRRLSLNKLSTLEPQPVRRYEREKPGELIHIDIKKLGRIGSVGHRITGPLQLAQTSCQYRLKAPHQPSRPHWEQPIEAPQLANGGDPIGRRCALTSCGCGLPKLEVSAARSRQLVLLPPRRRLVSPPSILSRADEV